MPVCPVHATELTKKQFVYGEVTLATVISKKYIPAGCCLPEKPLKFGYECPNEGAVYFYNEKGKLEKYEWN